VNNTVTKKGSIMK